MIQKKVELKTPLSTASMDVFYWSDGEEYKNRIRPAIVVCTGGAYKMLSDQENQPMVAAFLSLGFHVATLSYSLTPAHWPTQLYELAEAVAELRKHAEEYCVDANQIWVSGFSAGGHLAASLGVNWHRAWLTEALGKTAEDIRPNAMLLGYPVLSAEEPYHKGSFKNLLGEDWESRLEEVSLEKFVTEQTPPCFIWHTGGDTAVPCEGTLSFVTELQMHSVPYEYHLFEQGRHSLALATALTDIGKEGYQNPCVAEWKEMFHRWAHVRTGGMV